MHMAGLNVSDTKQVAKLAKLDITKPEIEKFTNQLSQIIDHIKELSSLNTDNIEPTSQTTGLTNVLRDDEIVVTNCLSNEEAISGKDDTENGFFVVPQILNKNDN